MAYVSPVHYSELNEVRRMKYKNTLINLAGVLFVLVLLYLLWEYVYPVVCDHWLFKWEKNCFGYNWIMK